MEFAGSGEARDRVRRLRWKAVAICMVCFALLWGVITIQMAQGDDPALGSEAASGAGAAPREPQGGFPERDGFGAGPQGSPEEFLFEGGGSPEGLGESPEGLEPLHTRQS